MVVQIEMLVTMANHERIITSTSGLITLLYAFDHVTIELFILYKEKTSSRSANLNMHDAISSIAKYIS